MDQKRLIQEIQEGQTVLGIELGSTRIKAILINSENEVIAQGGHDWENSLRDGIWTYALDDVWKGISACFSELKHDVQTKYA
ncbi:MAG: ATPase, partial [Sphaerochaeta sp.]